MENFAAGYSSPESLITKEIITIVKDFVCSTEKEKTIRERLFQGLKNIISGSWKVYAFVLSTYFIKNPDVLLLFLGKIARYLFYKKIYLKISDQKESLMGNSLNSEIKSYSQTNDIKNGTYVVVNSIPIYMNKSGYDYSVEYIPFIHTSYLNKIESDVEKQIEESKLNKKLVYKTIDSKMIEITNLFPSRNNKMICDIVSTFFRVSNKTKAFFTLGILINGKEGLGKTESLSYLVSQGACDNGILIDMNKNLDIAFREIMNKIFSLPTNGRYAIYIDELDKYLDYYLKNEYRKVCAPPKDFKKDDYFETPNKEEFMQTKKEEFLMKLLGLIETRYFKDGVVFVFCANNFNTIFDGVNMKHFRSVYKRIHKIYFQECHTEEFKEYCRWYNKTLEGDDLLHISEETLEKYLRNVREGLHIPLREVFFANVESCFNIEKLVTIVNNWEEEDLTKIDTSSPRKETTHSPEKISSESSLILPSVVSLSKDSSPISSKKELSSVVPDLPPNKPLELLIDEPIEKVSLDSIADSGESNFRKYLESQLKKQTREVFNRKDKLGDLPLIISINYQFTDCLKFLLSNRAKINIVDGNGFIPLRQAVTIKYYEGVKILLEYGAYSKLTYEDEKTLFDLTNDSKIRDLLIKYGGGNGDFRCSRCLSLRCGKCSYCFCPARDRSHKCEKCGDDYEKYHSQKSKITKCPKCYNNFCEECEKCGFCDPTGLCRGCEEIKVCNVCGEKCKVCGNCLCKLVNRKCKICYIGACTSVNGFDCRTIVKGEKYYCSMCGVFNCDEHSQKCNKCFQHHCYGATCSICKEHICGLNPTDIIIDFDNPLKCRTCSMQTD
jgi:hypothetical protein